MTNPELPSGLQLCTFRLGDLFLGVDVLDVQEVLYQADVTTVPLSSAAVSGLINLRGQIATTVDLRTRLGVAGDFNLERPTHVVVKSAGESVSLIVDRVDDVIDVDPGLYEAPPDTMVGAAADLILGAYKLEDELLLILDVAKAIATSPTNSEEAA